MTIAGPPYRSPEACHGPCYVLDPFAYELGERVVLEILPAKNPRVKKPRKAPQERLVKCSEMRRVVISPIGRAWDWKLIWVPVRPPEPFWAASARRLRSNGWAIRRILKELGLNNMRRLQEILDKYTV